VGRSDASRDDADQALVEQRIKSLGHAWRHAVPVHFPVRPQSCDELPPFDEGKGPPQGRGVRSQTIYNATPVLAGHARLVDFLSQLFEQRLGAYAARRGEQLRH
jgi:hypothetical protein